MLTSRCVALCLVNHVLDMILSQKNVWKSDKSWEPEKIWKFRNLNSKFKIEKLKWLKLILGKCWTTFVFMSRLKSRCLKLKMSMLFLAGNQLYELKRHRGGWWGGGGQKNHSHFHLQTVTFEHRHENKNCSACPEDQLKPF